MHIILAITMPNTNLLYMVLCYNIKRAAATLEIIMYIICLEMHDKTKMELHVSHYLNVIRGVANQHSDIIVLENLYFEY